MYTDFNSRVVQFNGVVLLLIGIFLLLAAVGVSPFGIVISGKFLAIVLGFEFIFSGAYLLIGGKKAWTATPKVDKDDEIKKYV